MGVVRGTQTPFSSKKLVRLICYELIAVNIFSLENFGAKQLGSIN